MVRPERDLIVAHGTSLKGLPSLGNILETGFPCVLIDRQHQLAKPVNLCNMNYTFDKYSLTR